MKQTITKVCQLAIAVLIGALAMTVYIQHRELMEMERQQAQQQLTAAPKHQQELWDPTDGWKTHAAPSPSRTPVPFNIYTFTQPLK